MNNVLYFQTGRKSLTGSVREFLTGRTYQAFFCDDFGERKKLEECLESLEAGDTLFLLRESHLADDAGGCVRILRELTGKGVNVWIERIRKMFSPESSPFSKSIGVEEADACIRLTNSRFTQKKDGTGETIQERESKPRKSLPEGFEKARMDWLSGRATGREAAFHCGMPLATFRKWAKHSEESANYGCTATR